jgi:hypothetical protein
VLLLPEDAAQPLHRVGDCAPFFPNVRLID